MKNYKDEYSKQYSCIVKSSKSNKHAFCTICSADISISRILPYFGALSPFFKHCSLTSAVDKSAYLLTYYCRVTVVLKFLKFRNCPEITDCPEILGIW